MSVNGRSNLATFEVAKLRKVKDRSVPVYGVAVHCTGSGIVEKALKNGADPMEFAVAHYLKPENYFAHYVIGFNGEIAQIADEHEKAQHIGQPAEDRAKYLDGSWVNEVSIVDEWSKRWPDKKSPAHLYPGKSPNDVYVGMELLVWLPGCDGEPMGDGLRYTQDQHEAAAELTADIAQRWKFPEGWEDTGRLVAHEDITPLTRSNGKGGWDPGIMRKDPWFDWSYFVCILAGCGV